MGFRRGSDSGRGPEPAFGPPQNVAGSPPGSDYGMESVSFPARIPAKPKAPVSKALAFTGLIVSGLIVILFFADLAVAFPFGRTSILLDFAFIVSGLITAYLSWSILDHSGSRHGPTASPLR